MLVESELRMAVQILVEIRKSRIDSDVLVR